MRAERPLTLDDFEPVGLEEWRRRVAERLESGDLRQLDRRSPDGVGLKALYTADDLQGFAPAFDGLLADVDGWSLCPLVDQGEPLEVGALWADDLAGGADGSWLRLDRAARLGLEPDRGEAVPHLGQGGALLHHGSDLGIALGGAALGGASLSTRSLWLDAGANALPATALCLTSLKAHGVDAEDLTLHCGADPLGALARDGRLPRDLMKLDSEMAVLARFSRRHLRGGRAIVVSSVPYHDAGADVVGELSYAVATLVSYLRSLAESGLSIGEAAAEIALRLAVGSEVFIEIAKLRAARSLWTMVLRACGVDEPPPLEIHAVGSWRTLSLRDSWNNVLRSTGQSLAAVCGGAGTITLHGFDSVVRPSSGRARRLARTIQLVLAEESRLAQVVDPGAGSYCIESLTRQLAAEAWRGMQEIERRGGMRSCLLDGSIQDEVSRAGDRRAESIESGERPIVGVNVYPAESEAPLERASPSADEVASAAADRLEAHRRRRATMATVAEPAYSRDFVVDDLTAAAAAGATLAELASRLGDGQGAETIEPLTPRRDAAPYETGFGDPAR